MRRWIVAAGVLLLSTSCSLFGESPQGVAVKTGDFVFVRFFGSAHVHSQAPGSQVWTDATYQWQEVSMVQIGNGDTVQQPTLVDSLRGHGHWTLDSPLFGSCTVDIDSLPNSRGADEGVSILNEGSSVQAMGIAPWSLHKASNFSGTLCHPPADPVGAIVSPDVGPLTCVLQPNQHCTRSAGLPASDTPGDTQTGEVTMTAYRTTEYEYYEEYDYLDELFDDILWGALIGSDAQANVSVSAPGLGPAPADGDLSLTVSQNGTRLGTIQSTVQKGAVPRLSASWQQAGSATLPINVTATYSVHGGPALTQAATVYLPATVPNSSPTGGSTPTITAVAFHGTPANPTIVITGQNLGSQPPAQPEGHPSGQGGCPVMSDDAGYDYGTSLYLAVPSGNWSAGRYNPSAGETDCFDLVVSKFTPTEVDYTFGALYGQQTKDQLTPGTAYQVAVNGATFTGTVAYS